MHAPSLTSPRAPARIFALGIAGVLSATACAGPRVIGANFDDVPVSAELARVDRETLASTTDMLALSPVDEHGTLRAIIEIPAGTLEKWEIDKSSPRTLRWERNAGGPRTIAYLAYPANYGVIPGTLASRQQGGDGDPLDVLVLGAMVPRGATVAIEVIGVLKMIDSGEADDKLIAVPASGSPFSSVRSIAQLDADFPGVTDIIETWFAHYKGQTAEVALDGFAGPKDAADLIAKATLFPK